MTRAIKISWGRLATISGALLFLLLGAWLIATSRPSAPPGGKLLTLTVPAGVETDAVYRAAIARFEAKNPDVKVNFIPIGGDYYRKVMVMIAGNVAPDLMWMGQSFGEFADRDAFLDVTPFVQRDGIDLKDYEPTVIDGVSRNGKLYALPFGMDFAFLVYNRAMFREAGLPEPYPGWSYSEFLEAARAIVRRDSAGRLERYGCKGGLDYMLFGATIFDPETGAVRCNSPEMLDFFHTNLALSYRERVIDTPEDTQLQGLDPLGYFTQERTAMMTLFTWDLPAMRERFAALEWGITLHPKVKQQAQWSSSHAICIARDSKLPEEAWKLSLEFQTPEFQEAVAMRMLPGRRSIADAYIAAHPELPELGVLQACRAVLQPTPRIAHLQELNAVFSRFSDLIWARRTTPEAAMAECEKELVRRQERFAATEAGRRND